MGYCADEGEEAKCDCDGSWLTAFSFTCATRGKAARRKTCTGHVPPLVDVYVLTSTQYTVSRKMLRCCITVGSVRLWVYVEGWTLFVIDVLLMEILQC